MRPLTEPDVDPKVKLVVYVDDDEEDRAFFIEASGEIDRNVKFSVFENGYDLIGYLRKIENKHLLPFSIVCDMKMPLLGGIELLKLLKENPAWQGIPFVIFTTSSSTTDSKESFDAGALAFFSKPSSLDDLKTTIEKILELSARSVGIRI